MLSDCIVSSPEGPELILPSEWLPQIWAVRHVPKFPDEAEGKAILAPSWRYDEILRQIWDDAFDTVLWAVGRSRWHAHRCRLGRGISAGHNAAADAWKRLSKSKRDGQLLFPIPALCGLGSSQAGARPWKCPSPVIRGKLGGKVNSKGHFTQDQGDFGPAAQQRGFFKL